MPTEPQVHVFAYGSNMYGPQMTDRCPGAEMAGVGRLPEFRFRINSRGVATIVPESGSLVYGILWRLNEKDEARLDGFEGVRAGNYRKDTLTVELLEGSTLRAMVYIDAIAEPGAPREGYLEKILMGAKNCDLPGEYLEELDSWKSGSFSET